MQKTLEWVKSPYTLVFAGALILSFTKLSIVSLVLCLIGWTLASRQVFGRRFYTSYLAHFFLGFLLFCSLNSILAIICRLANAPVALPYVVFVNVLALLALRSFLVIKQRPSKEVGPVRPSWVVIVVSLLLMASFTLPIALKPTTGSLLNYSVFGYDDAAHLQMFRGNINAKGFIGHIDKNQNPTLNLDPTIASYPQSLHFNLSVFARSIFTLLNTTAENIRLLLLTYHLGLTVVYGAIVVLLAEVVAQTFARIRNQNKLNFLAQLGIGMTVFIIYATLVYPEIGYAGQTFLATIAMVCGTILSLLMLEKYDGRLRMAVFGAACLIAVGVTYTWILSLLVAFAALILGALTQPSKRSLLGHTKDLFQKSGNFSLKKFSVDHWPWIFIVVSFVLSLPQVYILLTESSTGIASVNIDGGIGSPDHTRYLILALALIVGTVLAAVRKAGSADTSNMRKFLDYSLVLLTPMLLVLFFYAIQIVTTGQLTYYFTKSTYLAYIAILALVGVVAMLLLAQAEKLLGKIRALYLFVILFGVLSVYLSVGRGFLIYSRGTNYNVDAHLTAKAGELIDSGVRPRNIISYTGRTYEEDMFFNLITDQLDQYRDPNRHVIAILAQQKRYKVFKQFVGDYTKRDERTYIIVSKATEQTIRKALPGNGNYEVIVLNK
jgi:hypothetical protein